MQKNPIRRDEPILIQKRKAIKRKINSRSKTKNERRLRKKFGIYNPEYAKNRESILENALKYDSEHPDKMLEKHKRYIKKLREGKFGIRKQKYHARRNRALIQKCTKPETHTKKCTICGKVKGIAFFDKIKSKQHSDKVTRPYCMHCRREMNKEYYRKNKEKWEGINDRKRVHREE